MGCLLLSGHLVVQLSYDTMYLLLTYTLEDFLKAIFRYGGLLLKDLFYFYRYHYFNYFVYSDTGASDTLLVLYSNLIPALS